MGREFIRTLRVFEARFAFLLLFLRRFHRDDEGGHLDGSIEPTAVINRSSPRAKGMETRRWMSVALWHRAEHAKKRGRGAEVNLSHSHRRYLSLDTLQRRQIDRLDSASLNIPSNDRFRVSYSFTYFFIYFNIEIFVRNECYVNKITIVTQLHRTNVISREIMIFSII